MVVRTADRHNQDSSAPATTPQEYASKPWADKPAPENELKTVSGDGNNDGKMAGWTTRTRTPYEQNGGTTERVLKEAMVSAMEGRCREITCEHIFAAIATDADSTGRAALAALGINPADAAAQALDKMQTGRRTPLVEIQMSDQSKDAEDNAAATTSRDGREFTDTGDLVVGIVSEGRNGVAALLRRHGLNMEAIAAKARESRLQGTEPALKATA